MQKQAMPRTSKEWVDEMLRDHYRDARQAKEDGRLVCWSTSIAPQELLTTMDIVTMYPENHAAAIGARRDTEPFIAYGAQGVFFGFMFLCSGQPGVCGVAAQ